MTGLSCQRASQARRRAAPIRQRIILPRMKNQPNASRILAALVSRAASLELWFVGKDLLTKLLAMYPGFIIGFANPNLSTLPVSMRLGDVQELRFVEAGAYSSCTVICWAVLQIPTKAIAQPARPWKPTAARPWKPFTPGPTSPKRLAA